MQDRVDEDDLTAFEATVSYRVKLVAFGLALALFFGSAFVITGVSEIIASEGVLPFVVAYLFLMPLVYLPLVVEFVLMYVSVHVLVPRRDDRADIGLFFSDPPNMGVFATLGQLLKRSYYLYTAGLLLYFSLVYGPVLVSRFADAPVTEPCLFEAAFFSTAWPVGIASIAYSMVRPHRIMAGEKNERIRELEAEMRETIDNPYDINASEVADRDRLADLRRRLDQVLNTRVYPATFTIWSQIAVSLLLPQALQVAVQATT